MGKPHTYYPPGYLPEQPHRIDQIPAQPRPPLQIPVQPRRINQIPVQTHIDLLDRPLNLSKQFPVHSRQIDQLDQFPVQPHQTKQSQQNFYNIKCPFCRKENSIPKSQSKIVGSEKECVVCFEKADMFLPQCGHINICLECIIKIDASGKN